MKTLRIPNLVGATWMSCILAVASGVTAFAQSTVTRIPTLGGSAVDVRAMNRSGALAGFSRTAIEEEHACLFSGGVLHDLGTLGGPSSVGLALNDTGDVAGDSLTTNGSYHAFIFRNGTMTDLGTLEGGSFSFTMAINNAGHVLGQGDASDGYRGFLHRDGTLTDIGSLGSGFSTVYGLNNQGDVVGDSYTDTFEGPHAFVYRGGSISDLGTLGGAFSRAKAINDSGVIVGESYDTNGALRGFRYSNGTMQDLGTLGGTESWARMINNAGDILGDSHTADDHYRSFILRNGTMTDLGTFGGNWNTAYDLNNLGHVVGEAGTATGTTLPFIWRDGVMTDLNTLLPPSSGWLLASAYHINDADQIVGFGFYNGEFAWYLLTLEGNANQPPVANAGADQTVECSAMTQLDGSASSDPDNDPLTFEWREGTTVLGYGATLSVNLGLGTHTLTLTVRDSNELSSDDTLIVVVQDTTAPTVACEQTRTVAAGGADCQALVPDFASSAVAFDGCTGSSGLTKSQLPLAGAVVGFGTHEVVVSVRDASGNVGTCTVLLTVADVTPPTGECAPAMTVSTGVECHGLVPDFTGALMATDNCTPAAQLVKTQSPAAGTMMPLGSHDITLTVADAAGNKSMCVTKLHVVDNTAPVVNCPAGVTANAGAEGQAAVPDFTAGTTASDNCSDSLVKTQVPVAGTMLGLGTHNVTVTVTDAAGNRGSCTTTFTVVDNTPPVFLDISVTPNVLNTANRAMVPIMVSVSTTDNCDSAPVSRILSISSDEPVTGHADNTSPDWVVDSGLTGEVRAECVKKGDGRIYTITVICTDASGNSSTATTTVLVPSKNDGGPSKRTARPVTLLK